MASLDSPDSPGNGFEAADAGDRGGSGSGPRATVASADGDPQTDGVHQAIAEVRATGLPKLLVNVAEFRWTPGPTPQAADKFRQLLPQVRQHLYVRPTSAAQARPGSGATISPSPSSSRIAPSPVRVQSAAKLTPTKSSFSLSRAAAAAPPPPRTASAKSVASTASRGVAAATDPLSDVTPKANVQHAYEMYIRARESAKAAARYSR